MNIEYYKIYLIKPNGKADKAWQAFKEKDRIHAKAIKNLLKELNAETCATDRGGIAGIRFKEIPDEKLWRMVPGSTLWMPRAKTNRALYDRLKEERYETNGWWKLQKLLGCDSFLCMGMTVMWPMVQKIGDTEVLLIPDCTKWTPEDCEEISLVRYFQMKEVDGKVKPQ